MINQGADNPTINGVLNCLKTNQQRKEMMEYLISIRELTITQGEVLKQALDIAGIIWQKE